MTIRSIIILAILIPIAFSVASDTQSQLVVSDIISQKGNQYRKAAEKFLSNKNATEHLEIILRQETSDSMNSIHARILLAHIQHPEVFSAFDNEILKWRASKQSSLNIEYRPGVLSGRLMKFIKLGPETMYVDEKSGNRTWEMTGAATNKIVFHDVVFKKEKKYTERDVQAGIARNAAARQAVLEHFLKFLDEGDAYEQSEMVEVVSRLWGHKRSEHSKVMADIDHIQDADKLIESVFQDGSRPITVRMGAAFCLSDNNQDEVQAFMLNIVTNISAVDTCYQDESMVNKALAYLEFSADTNTLAVLKGQTNAPAWKLKKIEKSIHAIELRLRGIGVRDIGVSAKHWGLKALGSDLNNKLYESEQSKTNWITEAKQERIRKK